MANIEIILPAMGEGIIEATITRWLVEEGSFIKEDDPVVEVATDKVDTEIPSPGSGILSKKFYKEGEIPKVGEVIALLKSDIHDAGVNQEESELEETSVQKEEAKLHKSKTKPESVKKEKKISRTVPDSQKSRFISPFIRFQAMKREISFRELQMIEGTGIEGRLTKEDLNNYIRDGRKYKQNKPHDIQWQKIQRDIVGNKGNLYEYSPLPEDEVIPMDRTRKIIADHMVHSKKISPHVTSTIEIDITALVQWRESVKEEFQKKYGCKLTYTHIITEVAVKSIKKYPGINVSVVGDQIIRKKNIHMGVATALPDGNLIVTVVRNADKSNLPSLARTIHDLSSRARDNKLHPSEIVGSTFTITNMGQYDNISGTPIINQPEVAILAIGAIKKKPGVSLFEGQHTIGIRDILVLSLTYDHRVVDGSLGGSFLREIGGQLENYDVSIHF